MVNLKNGANEFCTEDGVEFTIIEIDENVIKIIVNNCSIMIEPIVCNSFKIHKKDVIVPKSTLENLKKRGLIE